MGGTVASWLVCSTPERTARVLALAGDIVLCSRARHFTLTVPLSTQVYKWVPANCWGNLTSCGEVTCDGLASHPGEVEILLAVSCYRNWDKHQELWANLGSKASVYYKCITGYDKYINAYHKYTKDFLEKNIYGFDEYIYGYTKKYLKINDLEAFFLHSISSLFRQAERNLHSDNLIVLEYFECRLDDHAYVIRSVILRCQQQSASEGLIQLLDLVHEEVNSLNDQYQDLCDTQRNFGNALLWKWVLCVQWNSLQGEAGQDFTFRIPEEVIRGLHDVHGERSGQRSTCILQNYSTKVTSVFHGS